jgi:AcrR family transcriptional regulator
MNQVTPKVPDPQPGDDTRTRLLDAARDLFIAHGFQGTSTRAIAAGAGCNLSLIKYYFGSKEGLLRAVLQPEIESVRPLIESLAGDGPPTPERLREFFLGMARQLDANRHFFRLMFAELMREDSPLGGELLEPVRRNQQSALRVLENARDAGVLRDVDLRATLLLVMGSLLFYHLAYPVASHLVGPRSPEVIDRIGSTAADVFLHGILLEKPR